MATISETFCQILMTACVLCRCPFGTTTDELAFLERISPKIGGKHFSIPTPTLCPECRLKRRTTHRNESKLYNNTSDLSGTDLISLYKPLSPLSTLNHVQGKLSDSSPHQGSKSLQVWTKDEWWSDRLDATKYGRDFDFSRPFFEQFAELLYDVPMVNLIQLTNENSEYTTGTGYCKNCYLINSSENCQDCYYGKLYQRCENVMDSAFIYDSQIIYEGFNLKKCYNCMYVSNSQGSFDCLFSDNLRSCNNCFLCTNLVKKEYHFMNQPLGKEEYRAKVEQVMGKWSATQQAQERWRKLQTERTYKYAQIVNSENSTGDYITNCKNCTECFDMSDSEDCRYVTVGVQVKDLMDCSNMYIKPELCYECLGTTEVYNCLFSLYIFYGSNLWYCNQCWNSNNLFGCVGLKKNVYCIFNKQYTKQEYEELVRRIIKHMQTTGEWGQYFPVSLSPFGYNESVANEYFPMTKEEAVSRGYNWSDYVPPFPQAEKTVPAARLPDDIKDIPDEILHWAVECEVTKKPFRIIKQELQFLREHGLPLPRRHPEVRYADRLALRNPRRLYERKCPNCQTPFQTTFAPERPERVLCEACYLREVY